MPKNKELSALEKHAIDRITNSPLRVNNKNYSNASTVTESNTRSSEASDSSGPAPVENSKKSS
jgi:hypothetical protein